MARVKDWYLELHGEMAAASTRSFAWGLHDCCLHAARCIDRMTGSALEVKLHSLYHDEASAFELIKRHGGLAGAVDAILGLPRIEVKDVKRGDLALIDHIDVEVVGIVMGAGVVCVRKDGLACSERSRILVAWGIR